MIKIERRRAVDKIHPDFTGAKLVAKLLKLAEARAEHGDDLEFESVLGDWKKTKDFLKEEAANKCAYCEADTAVVAHGDVEHFRPKSNYWWLALCVDNYVYSCQICNQTYKGDGFPIGGKKLKQPRLPAKFPTTEAGIRKLVARLAPDPAAATETEILTLWLIEDADLPHPYLEDPEKMFGWAVAETSEEVHLVAPARSSARAKRAVTAAIDYLGLNRETLLKLRFLIFQDLRFKLMVWKSGSKALRQEAAFGIARMCQSDFHFAGMCRYFTRKAGFPLPQNP
jgi:hypothetical protein